MKALDGVNLVEFSSSLAAAYAAMLLAEHGARVIKVEPPGGAEGRGTPHFHVANRSKRSVVLDLESQSDAAQVRELIRWADIVVEGHTPARARELGLDYESIRSLNPRTLAVSMPPLGSRGPDADFDATEDMAQARGGLAGNQFTRSGDPAPLTFPAAAYAAGAMAAIGAVAALLARGERDEGQRVEVSPLAAVLAMQTGSIMRHEKLVALYAESANDPLGPIPSFRLFEAADGRHLFVACGSSVFWNKFALAIERPELVSDPRFEGAPWGCQDHWPTLKEILEAEIRKRPRAEWLRILREGDVPCAPVHTRQEFIDDPQVRFLGMRREVVDPVLGPTIQMGVPVTLHDTPGDIAGPAPTLDSRQHRAADLITANDRGANPDWRSDGKIGAPDRGPLAGVTVLDFTSYIAGSYGAMILAQLGADVIKMESTEGDPVRHLALAFLGWNQSKRAVSLRMKVPEGRALVHELVKKADIVVENMRPGRMRKLGLDYETLAELNPRLIYMSVSGFGSNGPRHDEPGFDPLLQARSGAQAAQGGHHAHPVLLTCSLCDYGAAMLSALGCLLALRARQETGRGQRCETSLLQAALAFQAGEFVFYDGRPDMENGDPEYRGRSALARCYRCRDGRSLCLAIQGPAHWAAMNRLCPATASVAYADAARESAGGRLAALLGEFFGTMDRDEALRRLTSAGIPATIVNRIKDLFADPQIAANELLTQVVHPQWGPVVQTGNLASFSATVPRAPAAAPMLGEHTAEVLAEYLGYDSAKIAALRERGLIK